jgi:hypothetical protein
MTIQEFFAFQFSNQLECNLVVTVVAAQNVATGVDTPTQVLKGSSVPFKFTLASPQVTGELIFVIDTEIGNSSSQAAKLGFQISTAASGGGYTFKLAEVTALLINVFGGDPIPASLTTQSFDSLDNTLFVLISLPESSSPTATGTG